MQYETEFSIGQKRIALDAPTYFIADIAASHDGELSRAKDLIWKAKEAGADAAKFQHFLAKDIVSDRGFRDLGTQQGHQSKWKKSVYQIYEQYECPRDWSQELHATAKEAGIHFFTTPYDAAAVDLLDPLVPAYKIGSGDITWPQFIAEIAKKKKPLILATGAADMADVERSVEAALKHTRSFALLQCNTNYTGSLENFRFVNLRVLQTFAKKYPGMVLGLSDHTPGHSAVLGAITLGARIIEKHFTDDRNREGPDHGFSLDPKLWRSMVDASRELEYALGDGVKRVEENEKTTVVLQRRCLRLKRDLPAGAKLAEADLEALRPAPAGSFAPYQWNELTGKTLKRAMQRGEAPMAGDLS